MTKMLSDRMFDEFLDNLSERYEAYDLIEMIDERYGLTAQDVIDAFYDHFQRMYLEENEDN